MLPNLKVNSWHIKIQQLFNSTCLKHNTLLPLRSSLWSISFIISECVFGSLPSSKSNLQEINFSFRLKFIREVTSVSRSNWFLPEICNKNETCIRVGHFGGLMHFSRKKCDSLSELMCIFTNTKWLRNDQKNGRLCCRHSWMIIAPKINLTEGSIWPTTMKPPSE